MLDYHEHDMSAEYFPFIFPVLSQFSSFCICMMHICITIYLYFIYAIFILVYTTYYILDTYRHIPRNKSKEKVFICIIPWIPRSQP